MIKALIPVAAGIIAAGGFTLPLWGAAAGFGACIAAARAARRPIAADVYICLALFMAGWCAAELRYDSSHTPVGEGVAEIAVDEITARRDGILIAEGRIAAFETAEGVDTHCRAVRISADPSLDLSAGERIVALCRIKPYSRHSNDGYERYMARMGFVGQVTVTPQNIMSRRAEGASFGSRLQTRAVERIKRLGLPPEIEALTRAVAVGDRSGITPDMRRRYSRAGTAHLLAVSGLHVGFVFAIVNLLLWWMPLLRRGHLLRCAAAVAAIWLYAAVAGLSPSVTRAAAMFTVLQLATGLSVRFDTLNSLALTAFVMLLFDARNIADAGFIMSFAAVAAITEWGVPLGRLGRRDDIERRKEKRDVGLRTRFVGTMKRIGRRLWGLTAVSFAAATATMPSAALFFGAVSFMSIVTGPAAILPSAVLLGAGIVWSLAPLPDAAPAAARVMEVAGGALEAVAQWGASAKALSFEIEIDITACVAIYIVFIAFTVWLRRRSK